MGRPRKVPAVLVEATIRRNAKLAALPSDTARLGYFYLLGDAKLSEPVPGQFASRAVFRNVAGRFEKYLDHYIREGLLEVAPKLCERCRDAWSTMPPKSGVLVVHDWHQHQYDPRRIERQREYDERQRGTGERPVSDGVSDAQSDGVSDAVSDAISDGVSDTNLTVFSRPRARRTSNVERRTKKNESGSSDVEYPAPDAAEPTLSKSEHQAWSTFGSEWDAVKAAWIGRGLRLPPTGGPIEGDDSTQRGVLFQVLDARPTDLVAWIREAPGKTSHDVIRHVLTRWHEIRAQVGADEDLEKAWGVQPSKGEALETVGQILARIAQG